MFTGLIKDVGKITAATPNLEGKIFEFETKLAQQISVDDSVAVNGVCLTAIYVGESCFRAQAIHVTLAKTNLGQLESGVEVNLELAMRLSDRLGGHLVSGHVNDTGVISEIFSHGDNYHLWILLPPQLMKFIVKEGSIALDGISLTIADIKADGIMVAIIPHTWQKTQMHNLKVGSIVNIEIDSNAMMMAKYLDGLFANYLKERGH